MNLYLRSLQTLGVAVLLLGTVVHAATNNNICRNWVSDVTVIDATNDEDFGSLMQTTLDLAQVGHNSINFRADIDPCAARRPSPTKSVMFHHDGEKYCKREAPFSVYGVKTPSAKKQQGRGKRGKRTDGTGGKLRRNNNRQTRTDYKGLPLTIGRHNLTAVPYTGSNCDGHPGHTHAYVFDVVDTTGQQCITGFRLMDYDTQQRVDHSVLGHGDLKDGDVVPPHRPCRINIEAKTGGCPAEKIQSITFVMTNKDTGKKVRGVEKYDPYFVFGDHRRSSFLSGELPPGNYSLEAQVKLERKKGKQFQSMDFEVRGRCNGGK